MREPLSHPLITVNGTKVPVRAYVYPLDTWFLAGWQKLRPDRVYDPNPDRKFRFPAVRVFVGRDPTAVFLDLFIEIQWARIWVGEALKPRLGHSIARLQLHEDPVGEEEFAHLKERLLGAPLCSLGRARRWSLPKLSS